MTAPAQPPEPAWGFKPTNPLDTTPRSRLAGRFSYTLLRRNRPHTLSTWRITTPHPHTARRLAHLLGGHPRPDPVSGQIEVITTTDHLDILLSGQDALKVGWERGAHHACDGKAQSDGRPCSCPLTIKARRSLAKQGCACQPRVEVKFWLAKSPPLGGFGFATDDWSFTESAIITRTAPGGQDSRRLIRARLDLQRSLHTLRSGRILAYTRPALAFVNDDPCEVMAGH